MRARRTSKGMVFQSHGAITKKAIPLGPPVGLQPVVGPDQGLLQNISEFVLDSVELDGPSDT